MIYVLLTIIAILPAAFYVLFIIAFDSQKPEPLKALLFSAVLGAVAALPFVFFGVPHQLEVIQIEEAHSIKESLEIGIFKLTIPVEFVKWLLLLVFLSINKFYDEYIDGIVYSVCLAMGFAGVWAACFLSGYADADISSFIEISLITVFVLIPIHFIAGTLMGYFIALAKKEKSIKNHALALFLPIVSDGILCSLVLMIRNHWEYYFFMGIVFTIMAMVVYSQIFHLQDLDEMKTQR